MRAASWRTVRLTEQAITRDLRHRHALWLHGWCVGLLVAGAMALVSHLQFVADRHSLALRYLVTLGFGYLLYLLVLRVWAGALLQRRGSSADGGFDLGGGGGGGGTGNAQGHGGDVPAVRSGGGGDFGGGGASADFEARGAGELVGDAAKGALEVAGSADEGAVVVIPVVAVFLLGVAVLFGTGSLLLLYFGSDALLAVAVELAFGYAAGRTVWRVEREGWLVAAIRLTWKPLLGALACAVLLGATIDHFLPQAKSLPQAVRLVLAQR